MSKIVKESMIGEVTQRFAKVKDCLVVDYTGTDGVSMSDLRTVLHRKGVRVEVMRNAVALAAFQRCGLVGLGDLIVGPSAVVYGGDDIVELAKSVAAWQAAHKTLKVRGGIVDGKPIGKADAAMLVSLPPKSQILGQFIFSLTNAAASVIQSAAGAAGSVLGANVDRLEKSAPAAEAVA